MHFPNRALEWQKLKNEALILKGYVDIVARGISGNNKDEYENAREIINNNLFPLKNKFKNFAQQLNSNFEDIGKYQIGTAFKYNKKCPICTKF